MRGVAQAANHVRAERAQVSAGNPFVASQQQFSKAMVDALKLNADRQRRMQEILHLVGDGAMPQGAGGIAAE